MDRQGARTPADLERKYQFGKKFQEIIGLVDDTRGAISEVESTLRGEISDVYSEITRSAEKIEANVAKTYILKDDVEDVKEELRSSLSQTATEIRGEVSSTTETQKEVNGELKAKIEAISKHFTFTENGMEFGATFIDQNGVEVKSPHKIVIDNDDITIYVNDKPVMPFKSDGTASIPQLTVTKSLAVLGLEITEEITEDTTYINIECRG